MSLLTRMRAIGPDGLAAATGFLTVIPVPESWAERGRAHATLWFPWVGAGLGGVAASVVGVVGEGAVAGWAGVVLLAVLTGGLHFDGLADTLDAVWSPAIPRSRRLVILKDPRVGAHGALGIALVTVARVLALAAAPPWAVVAGLAASRWVMVVTMRWAQPLDASGSGARLRLAARPVASGLAFIPAVLVLPVLDVPVAELAGSVAAGLAWALLAGAFVVRRLGGLNGDGHGAVGLTTETFIWLVAGTVAA